MFEQYTLFETAFWQSLAAGEVSPELRALVSPDAMVGIEQGIASQPYPIGGSVTVRPSLDDLTIADVGFGMTLTEAVIAGCSDQTQLQYDGGATGASATITANVRLEPEGYLITNYALGPPAC